MRSVCYRFNRSRSVVSQPVKFEADSIPPASPHGSLHEFRQEANRMSPQNRHNRSSSHEAVPITAVFAFTIRLSADIWVLSRPSNGKHSATCSIHNRFANTTSTVFRC